MFNSNSASPVPLALPAHLGGENSASVAHMQRGGPRYPERLLRRMGDEAPAEIWLAGDRRRLESPQVGMVGSRSASSALLEAAERLARVLSDGGWVITSGLARGADTAAFLGGAAGAAGTLAVPACGLGRARLPEAGASSRVTLLGLAPPDQAFHGGLALRRNGVIAALSDVLILVASGWKGGSWHAIRQALREGSPILCLESGARTPKANAWLLERGHAIALSADASPAETLGRVEEAHAAGRRRSARRERIEPLGFLD